MVHDATDPLVRRLAPRQVRLAAIGAVALLLAGCGGSTSEPAPVITSFAASPASITVGGTSTLAWVVSGATTLSIDQGVGAVIGTSKVVSPVTASTTYTLTATNSGGSVTQAATVTVDPAALEVACSGTSCGASNPSLYSGSGVGVWRYRNTGNSEATIEISIGGVSAGQTALLLFSNGAEEKTTLPSAGTLAARSGAALQYELPREGDPTAEARDRAHGEMLQRNRELALMAAEEGAVARVSGASGRSALQAPTARAAENDERSWNDTAAKPPVAYATVARKVCTLTNGRNAVFWVDKAATAEALVTDLDLAEFEKAFCGASGGYAQVVALRGEPWGDFVSTQPAMYIQDAPVKQDIHVVFLEFTNPDMGGYFHSVSNFLKTQYPESNEALVFFVSAKQVKSDRGYSTSTLLHELTHLVNYYQRSTIKASPYDDWLDEMSAMMTEDVVVPAVTKGEVFVTPDQRIKKYVEAGGAVSLITWDPKVVNLAQYPAVGSLGAFLNRRHGLAIYTSMVDCPSNASASGVACVDSLIRAATANQSSFPDELARMGATAYGVLPATGIPGAYGFPEKIASGYTIPAVDVSAWKATRPAVATALGASFAPVTQSYQLDTIATGSTTYARPAVKVPAGVTVMLVIQ
jgi:hypothetical protein